MPQGRPVTRQRGQAAIILVMLLVFGAAALIYTLVNPAKIAIENDKKTADALARARDALIGFATGTQTGGTYRPGELPCPDLAGTGIAGASCSTAASRIGLLPTRTLGLPDLRDGSGERLWYAVSFVFKRNPQDGVLNSDTPGDFTVNGTNVIAVIFAPGSVMGNQNRDTTAVACATTGTSIARNLCAENYLEGGNQAAGATTFFTTGSADSFNDKLFLLTRENFFPAVEKRVATELADTLRAYYATNRYYPTAAALPGSVSTANNYRGHLPTTTCGPVVAPTYPNWFTANNWQHYVVYAVAPRCTPQVSTSLLWLGTASVCSIGGCLGPILGLYACVLPNTIVGGALDCDNTTAGSPPGSYLTVNGVGSIEAILMTPSYRLDIPPLQPARPCNTLSDCLEDSANTDADNTYVKPVRSSTNNDALTIVRP
jgi:hypothetical protein